MSPLVIILLLVIIMAAAATGARVGRQRAQREAAIKSRERFCKSREESLKRYEEEVKTIAKMLDLYDADQSRTLNQAEVSKMLGDYRAEALGKKEPPTEEEVECLVSLVDQNKDGRIEKREILNCLKTWFAYLEKKDGVMEMLKKFDLSRTGKINHGELRPLLQELNDGEEIPDDVLAWVWKQGDITGDGALSAVELTRAIASWYVWVPEEQPGGKPGMLAGNLDKSSMPAQPEPKKKSSICGVL